MLQDELWAQRVSELSAQSPQGRHWGSDNTLLSVPAVYLPITFSDTPS